MTLAGIIPFSFISRSSFSALRVIPKYKCGIDKATLNICGILELGEIDKVLYFFENIYAMDQRPRSALEDVKKWIKDPNSDNLKKCEIASDILEIADYVTAATYAAYADNDAISASFIAMASLYTTYAPSYADTSSPYVASSIVYNCTGRPRKIKQNVIDYIAKLKRLI